MIIAEITLKSTRYGFARISAFSKISRRPTSTRYFAFYIDNKVVDRKFVISNIRCLSTTPNPESKSNDEVKGSGSSKQKYEVSADYVGEYDDEYEEPKTAGQKVVAWSVLSMRLLLLAAGLGCLGLTVRELFPGRMSANTVFSESFDIVKINDEVLHITGDPVRAYGRDVGRNTEGRRNIVESRSYKDDDGSNRTRVRFSVEGPKGKVTVFAEVSNRMSANEYVYLMCQDRYTGRVITIHDNRARLDNEASSGSSESKFALSNLLDSFTKSR